MEALLAKVVGQSQDGDVDASAEDNSQTSSSSSNNGPPALSTSVTPPARTQGSSEQADHLARIKQEDLDSAVTDQLGQLALDDHGHLRWIGSSSTMSLIQSFRALTSEPVDRYSPPNNDSFSSDSMGNMLYFPPGLGFGKVRALPGPQEVEYPDRDLADTLVCCGSSLYHLW